MEILKHFDNIIRSVVSGANFQNFLQIISNTRFKHITAIVAKSYIHKYNNYSYDITRNGEELLISKIFSQKSLDNEKVIVFDVGANKGDWTAQVLKYSGNLKCDLHLFEINPDAWAQLAQKYNNETQVNLNKTGLGNITKKARFVSYKNADALNTLVLKQHFHNIKSTLRWTKIETGDSYCWKKGIRRIHLLKIDVEGFEFKVLSGFKNGLKNKLIDIVQFEYGYLNGVSGELMHLYYEYFKNYGYSVGKLTPLGVTFFPYFKYELNNFESGPNFIACLPKFSSLLQTF